MINNNKNKNCNSPIDVHHTCMFSSCFYTSSDSFLIAILPIQLLQKCLLLFFQNKPRLCVCTHTHTHACTHTPPTHTQALNTHTHTLVLILKSVKNNTQGLSFMDIWTEEKKDFFFFFKARREKCACRTCTLFLIFLRTAFNTRSSSLVRGMLVGRLTPSLARSSFSSSVRRSSGNWEKYREMQDIYFKLNDILII